MLASDLLQVLYLSGVSMLWAFKQFVMVFSGLIEDTVIRSVRHDMSQDSPMQALAPWSLLHLAWGHWCIFRARLPAMSHSGAQGSRFVANRLETEVWRGHA